MVVLGIMFFATVLTVSVWAIYATVAPRFDYIVALMTGPVSEPALVPVSQRRRVTRVKPLPLRSELRMIRAAA